MYLICLYYSDYLLAPAVVCDEEPAARLEGLQQLPEELLLALDVQDRVAAGGGELRWRCERKGLAGMYSAVLWNLIRYWLLEKYKPSPLTTTLPTPFLNAGWPQN